MNVGQLRLLVIGVVALGLSVAAQARGHAVHRGYDAPTAATMHSHHGTGLSVRSASASRPRFVAADIGMFRRHPQHRGFGRSYAYGTGHSGGRLQCVTFARADSGIELSGNASSWWHSAAGVYQRGSRPEAGSVLNFRANGAMRMGHVAVVNQVVDGRTIEIDHANWGGPGAVRGGISRDISVVDVSPANDWSAVRVALGHSEEFGSIYPTYGFIYNRPDHGAMIAANESGSPMPALNPAPRDLRGPARDLNYDEVAEAPDTADGFAGHHYGRARRITQRISYTHYGYTAISRHHRLHGRY